MGFFVTDQADSDGLFLQRYDFSPRLISYPENVWQLDKLLPARAPSHGVECRKLCALLTQTLDWLAEHESWVLQRLGAEYRLQCLRAWQKPALTAADQTAAAWQNQSQTINSFRIGSCAETYETISSGP
ncbi:MAG: hypothetical protein QXS54_10765 [Candidatus Methanomethylicaceae archaeon]